MCAGTLRERQAAFFIGGAPELQDLSYMAVPAGFSPAAGAPLNKYGFQTQRSGTLKVRVRAPPPPPPRLAAAARLAGRAQETFSCVLVTHLGSCEAQHAVLKAGAHAGMLPRRCVSTASRRQGPRAARRPRVPRPPPARTGHASARTYPWLLCWSGHACACRWVGWLVGGQSNG